MVLPPVDHDCELKDFVIDLANRLAKVEHENAQLKKALLGSRSEKSKLPRIKTEPPATPEAQKKTRQARAAAKAEIPTVRDEHKVPESDRRCTACGNTKLDPLGDGKKTVVFEFVPARFIRVEHVQEVLRCRCNGFVVTAPGSPKVVEKGRYGASFLAHLVVSKCADHTPIYRLEKAFARQGVPVARSTMNELLHRSSTMLEPIWQRLLDLIRVRPIVAADETRLRMIRDKNGKTKHGFVWTFGARDDLGELDIAYVFAEDRSGATPKTLLEGTTGVLLVDGYSGYNVVDEVSTRRRAACHAHLRRYFHEALPTAPIGLIGHAKLEFRRERAGPVRTRIGSWLAAQRDRHPPKSPIGAAIRYAQNHWDELGVFLDDDRVPLDNNGSERALRRVAMGRKNYLFVQDRDSGASLVGLYSLVATCEARGINPFTYLTDVLTRVQDTPVASIDELLPGPWLAARDEI